MLIPSGRELLREPGEPLADRARDLTCLEEHTAKNQGDRERRGAERNPGPTVAVGRHQQGKQNDAGSKQIQRVPPTSVSLRE